MSLRPPDPNETEARYTTVEEVKERVAIPASDLTRDDQILEAIVAAEFMLDVFCGRGFPDEDTVEEPAVITTIPAAVSTGALSLAIAVWKEADAPGGAGGSEAFFGTLSVEDTSRRILERSPQLVSFRRTWGIG